MTTIDRAAEVIYRNTGLDSTVADAERIAQALADAGLLAPEPHVVTSVEELRNLPDGTVIKCANYRRVVQKLQGYWYFTGAVEFHVNSRELLPATVLTPAPAPRATVTREQLVVALAEADAYVDRADYISSEFIYGPLADAILALLNGEES